MWARLSRFAGLPPERIDRAVQEFEEEELPAIEQLAGYQGVLVMVDRKSGKAAAVTFWAGENELKESDRIAESARERAIETAGPTREPLVDRYEVVIRK
jgi:hypothetical protein